MSDNTNVRRLDAISPFSLPGAAMPAIVSTAFIFWKHPDMNWAMAILALAAILLLLAAGCFWETCYTDNKNKAYLSPAICLWFIGICLAGRLMHHAGSTAMWLYWGGTALALLYPMVRKNIAGDIAVLLGCGFLPGILISVASTKAVDWSVLATAFPAGLVSCAILHAGVTGRIPTDKRADIDSRLVLGSKAAAYLYWFEMIVPYVIVGVLSMASELPVWTVFIFLTFPVALGCARAMVKSVTGGTEMIADLKQRTTNLQLMFSAVLALSLIFAGIL